MRFVLDGVSAFFFFYVVLRILEILGTLGGYGDFGAMTTALLMETDQKVS